MLGYQLFIFGQVDYIRHKSFAALHVQVIPRAFAIVEGSLGFSSSRARDQIPSLEHLMALFRGEMHAHAEIIHCLCFHSRTPFFPNFIFHLKMS